MLLWKWPCQLPRLSVPIQRGCLYCKRPSYCGAARPLNRLRAKHLRVWRRQTTSKRRDPSLVSRGQSNLRACCLLMFQIDKRLVHKLVWPHETSPAHPLYVTLSAIVCEGTVYPSNQSLRDKNKCIAWVLKHVKKHINTRCSQYIKP